MENPKNWKNWKIEKIEKIEKIGKSGKLKNWQIMKIKIQIDRRFWRPNIQELGIFGQKLDFRILCVRIDKKMMKERI